MAEKKAAATKAAEKKTRKTSTPEERVARLEAELAAAKERAEAKANKADNLLRAQRAKLIERRDALQEKIDAITDQLGDRDAGDNLFGEADDEQLELEV